MVIGRTRHCFSGLPNALWQVLSCELQPQIIIGCLKEIGNPINLAKYKTGHGKCPDANPAFTPLEPGNGSCRHPHAFGKSTYGNATIESGNPEILSQ